jgi:hypothetical protein
MTTAPPSAPASPPTPSSGSPGPSRPAPSVIGNEFVNQYYAVLHATPELLYRFYNEGSSLTIAGVGCASCNALSPSLHSCAVTGVVFFFCSRSPRAILVRSPRPSVHPSRLTTIPFRFRSVDRSTRRHPAPSVTARTQRGIKDAIVALAYDKDKAELASVDADLSAGGSVVVMVTGALASTAPGAERRPKRNFVQSFVLAPQENGYYVLNDIIRFLPAQPAGDGALKVTLKAAAAATATSKNGVMASVGAATNGSAMKTMPSLPTTNATSLEAVEGRIVEAAKAAAAATAAAAARARAGRFSGTA